MKTCVNRTASIRTSCLLEILARLLSAELPLFHRRMSHRHPRKFASVVATILGTFALVAPLQAFATIVTVNWSASATPNLPGNPSPGSGILSGTLGTFDVTAVGEVFSLTSDGSLSIDASGFGGGFPNGSYALTRGSSNPFQLEFLSIGPTVADFSVNIVDNNAGLFSDFPNPCIVNNAPGQCFVGLFDDSNNGSDNALAALGLDGTIDDESHGAMQYSFVVGPTDIPEPISLSLLAIGVLGLIHRRHREPKDSKGRNT